MGRCDTHFNVGQLVAGTVETASYTNNQVGNPTEANV